MAFAIYEKDTLLSITYCHRKIRELRRKENTHISGGLEYLYRKEIESICKDISYYRNVIERLSATLKELDDDARIDLITNEMASKIRKSHKSKIKVSFADVSDFACTVKVEVFGVFSTELSFKQMLFEKEWEYNEHYDGYHDLCEYVYHTIATDFLKEIVSKFNEELHKKLPDVEIKCYCA